MINKNKLMFGFEIELSINREKVKKIDSMKIGAYNHALKIKDSQFWKVKTDGSLRNEKFSGGRCLEIESKLLKLKDVTDALNEFKKIFGEGYELNEVLDFNKSCGSHIHFSYKTSKGKKPLLFRQKIPFELWLKMRKSFFEKIKESKVLKGDTKYKVLEHYFRGYAQKNTENNHLSPQKSKEFNILSEINNKGLEWRSINLYGVESWSEFFEVYKIAIDEIINITNLAINGFEINSNLRISKKDILEKLEQNHRTRQNKININWEIE